VTRLTCGLLGFGTLGVQLRVRVGVFCSRCLRFWSVAGCHAGGTHMFNDGIDENFYLPCAAGRHYKHWWSHRSPKCHEQIQDTTHSYLVVLVLFSPQQPCWPFWYLPPFAFGSLCRPLRLASSISSVEAWFCWISVDWELAKIGEVGRGHVSRLWFGNKLVWVPFLEFPRISTLSPDCTHTLLTPFNFCHCRLLCLPNGPLH
jgi:hypothetical protein